MRGFRYKKAIQALNFFAQKSGGQINKMKALKLIWLSDRLHLRKYGRTITGDIYFALPRGPVASTTRDILENNGLSDQEINYSGEFLEMFGYDYLSKKNVNFRVFSDSDIEVMDIVFEKYHHLDHYQLSELSHVFPEWKRYKSALENGPASRYEIDWNDFFENVDDKYGLFMDQKNYLNLSKEIFHRSHLL